MASPVSILLVDDDEKNLLVLETILGSSDYRLVKASTADEALMILMKEDFAAIVLDVKMPVMSGIELAQLIKQRRKTQHIPILFLTAHYYEDEQIVLGYDAGAVDYITKPVNPAILRSKIGVFVDLFRKTNALMAANEELALKNIELQLHADDRKGRIHAEAAQAEAEAANRAKDRFLAMLSHELRTPLSPVLHAVSLIEEEGCSPSIKEWVETIRRNVQLEARLIDDLLDLARIRNGKLQLFLENVEAHDLLRRALQICDADIKNKQIQVSMTLEATASHLLGDSARLLQIFWNILNNAIRYTPAHGHLKIKTLTNQTNGHLSVTVTDSGMGIAANRLDRIFDAFEQAHGPQSQGLGLGLAICKVLTEMHGGSIEAQSEGEGKGSVFTVNFPVSTVPKTLPANQGVSPKPEAIPLRILLVEDHPDTSASLKRLLEKKGNEVVAAMTVSEARQKIRTAPFDILISDMGLPDGRGIELMPAFLAHSDGRPVAGIALSGYGMPEDIERSHQAGFSEHLTKPIGFDALLTSLTHLSRKLFP